MHNTYFVHVIDGFDMHPGIIAIDKCLINCLYLQTSYFKAN